MKLVSKAYGSTSDYYRTHMVVLRVIFPYSYVTTVTEIEQFTLGKLFGEIGGQAGLFLGASLYTLIEILYFIIYSVAKRIMNLKTEWLSAE